MVGSYGIFTIDSHSTVLAGRATELVRDTERVWRNSTLFNSARSEYSKLASSMLAAITKVRYAPVGLGCDRCL